MICGRLLSEIIYVIDIGIEFCLSGNFPSVVTSAWRRYDSSVLAGVLQIAGIEESECIYFCAIAHSFFCSSAYFIFHFLSDRK